MPAEVITHRIRLDGDERGMLVDGYLPTASGAPRVSGYPKGSKFRSVMQAQNHKQIAALA